MAYRKHHAEDFGPAYYSTDVSYNDNEVEAYNVFGVGKKFERGAFNTEANLFKHSNELQNSRKGVGAMNRQEAGVSVGLGPVKVKYGKKFDTGIKVGDDGVEFKILGDGIKVGEDGWEAKFLGNGFTCTKDKVGAEVFGFGFKAGKSGMEIKALGFGVELKF